MAEKSSTDQTGEADVDKNVPPGGSMMVVTVKTPNGKEEITISEDSSVAQVRLRTLFFSISWRRKWCYVQEASARKV